MVLKLISKRLGDYCEKNGLLPEAQCGFRRQRSTVDMIFVARMLQEFGRDKDIPIYLCFIDLTKAYDTVDRKLLWLVLARFGVPDKMINIIRAFHDGMRATVRLGDGELSESFEVTRGLRQGCVLAPLLFNIFFTAVLNVAVLRMDATDVISKDYVYIKSRMDTDPLDASKRAAKTKTFVNKLWSMLYADDACIASLSLVGLGAMMTVIVSTCAEFGLTVSEKKTESMYCGTRSGETVQMKLEAAGQKYKQVDKFPYLGGILNSSGDVVDDISRRQQRAYGNLRKYCRQLYDQRHIHLKIKIIMFKMEVLEALLHGCKTWALKTENWTTLRQTHHYCLLRVLCFRKKKREDRPLSYSQALKKTDCESIETTVRTRRLLYAGQVLRMDDTRLPKIMMCGELNAGKRRRGGTEKQWRHSLREDLKAFEINVDTWSVEATSEQGWTTIVGAGATRFMKKWHAKEDAASQERVRARAAADAAADAAAAAAARA